jgi:hypothetical protein
MRLSRQSPGGGLDVGEGDGSFHVLASIRNAPHRVDAAR